MDKVAIKANAKINLTLDVLGKEGEYHNIKSLAVPVTLCDDIMVIQRYDHKISLTEKIGQSHCSIKDNNACKAASAFMKAFHTKGVDIILKKRIPVGGGMGGSSADIVGVLKAMAKLYKIKEDLMPVAMSLSSDAGFLLNNKWAVLEGRGEKITPIKKKHKFYCLCIRRPRGVVSKECYEKFDEIGKSYTPVTDKAVELLKAKKVDNFLEVLKNDLYQASKTFIPEYRNIIEELEKFGADKCILTGSGSVIVGLYKSKRLWKWAYKMLAPSYDKHLIKCVTM